MKWNKLSKFKIKRILRYFADELTLAQTAKQLHLNRRTTDGYYQKFQEQIASFEEQNLKYEFERPKKDLKNNWDKFGKIDPLWAILTHPSKRATSGV